MRLESLIPPTSGWRGVKLDKSSKDSNDGNENVSIGVCQPAENVTRVCGCRVCFSRTCGRHFRQLGWEVLIVASRNRRARKLAQYEHCPDTVVVLDVALLDQSGWLTRARSQIWRNPTRASSW